MKLSLAILAAAPAIAAGKRLNANTDLSNVQVKANSKTGGKLLSKARRLDGDSDTTWVAGYSLKFQSCTSAEDYYGGQFNQDNDNEAANYEYYGGDNQDYQNQNNADNNGGYNNGYYNNEQREDYQGMYQQKLVHFKLCPSDSCFRCKNGADYVVELSEFVDAMLEAKMTAQEYNCEHVRENCYCGDASSQEQCEYNCYQNAKMTECQDAMYDNGEDEFDVMEALECSQMDVDEDQLSMFYYNNRDGAEQQYYAQQGGDNNNMNKALYIGPYCSSNGKKIHLGVFREETCSYPAPSGVYEAMNYGSSLPYAKKSMIDSGCISCKEPTKDNQENYQNYQNYWDDQDADEVTEVCDNLYALSGKCEEGLDGYYPNRDVSGCGFIKSLKDSSILSSIPSANVPAKVFAGIFAVTTAAFAALAATLYKRNKRQNVSLAGDAIIS